jgi:hypothetical protein
MLFVVTHTHDAENCPADNPGPMYDLMEEDHIKESGVTVVSSYAAPPEHTLFFVIEADDYSQVVRYFRPLMTIGNQRIVPVQPFGEAQAFFPERP